MDFEQWTTNVERRIVELADRRTFRFRATRREHADAYLAAMRRCAGKTEGEIVALEQSVGVPFPTAYRAFVRTLGEARGHLFRGSDIEPAELASYRHDAIELIGDGEPLPADALVFMFHQGYTFCWLEPGDDPPVHQFIEGEGHRRCADRFTSFIDAELALMAEVNAMSHKQGGTYLTVTATVVREVHPALADGLRPIDHDDELI